jgi:hypothetical protein
MTFKISMKKFGLLLKFYENIKKNNFKTIKKNFSEIYSKTLFSTKVKVQHKKNKKSQNRKKCLISNGTSHVYL